MFTLLIVILLMYSVAFGGTKLFQILFINGAKK